MTTSSLSTLSADAKEFVPSVSIPHLTTIPLYINESTVASVYSPQSLQQQLIYPLLKGPEIEFHIQSSQEFHIDSSHTNPPQSSITPNRSQIVLLPTNRCYPEAQILYPPNDQSSGFYPINYSFSQPKSNRISSHHQQRGGINHSNNHRHSNYDQQESTTLNSRRNFHSTNNKRILKRGVAHAIQQRDQSNNENIYHPSVQSKSKTSNNNSKRNSSTEQQRSKSSTKNNESTKSPNGKPDEFIQTKQQKRAERRRQNKSKEISTPETIPFSLDDENAFPALGHEVPIQIAKKSENDSSTKNKPSIPGLINVSKIKAKQTYQICLTDMFNALNTSTQTKQDNSLNKTAKSSGKTLNSANPLDSNPVPKRGKEREQPKPRKPTKLKRIINKELEENQKQRQQFHVKSTAIKPTDEQDISCETDTNNVNGIDNFINDQSNDVVFPVNMNEYTSASCTDDSNDENDDDDDDEILDHEPTSQLQTPYAQQMPQSNIKQQIHDAGFREYCSQLIDRQLDELCIELLITLKRFQDRKKQQLQANPERARRKRRFVHGIREVTKHLRLQRLKCVLIAPDCQSIQSQGGLNDAIEKIINLCKEQNTPYIFTLNRQKLGRCLNKTSRISSIGIFDYSGADQVYKQIVDITCENQRAYKQIVDNILNHDESIATPSHGLNSREFYKILHRTFQQQQQPQLQKHHVVNIIPNESLSKVLPKVPAHYAHSRQTSDTSTIYIDPQLINSIIKQHTRASSGTFDVGKTATAATTKKHQRTLSDGATNVVNDIAIQTKHHLKTHSRTPSGCSVISQIEQQDYFEQSKNILMNSTNDICIENEENRLKSINEDTEENSANIKRKNVEKWINDN
ncbi:unnamed protein product [Rotaria magnacalcarata]|uniref:Ribosomal protein eL8/eL30/eS12/Gadd45 domain-containing protein n=1 Tax=Rotaria magnacalcarata TaxID=392030 RepID=A0A819MIQ9_9BILA|nr:unnamed protein product [Rotaria magnacalcarata]